jgi:hypothetical protein
MTPTRLAPFGALVAGLALAAGTVFVFAAPTDRPTTGEPPMQPEGKEAKHEKSVPQSRPAAPGIQALAAASTDIVVVDVLETNPSKAVEGARDTVRLAVARTLLGRLAPDDTFGVYYHLLWMDEKSEVLEPAKFQKGNRYLLFLRSHLEDRGGADGKRVVYELTDQWLAVQPYHVGLVKETVVAVRSAHGDAAGEWSQAVGPLEGRLVLSRSRVSNGTPIITARLDLKNVSGGDNTVEFNLDRATTTWTVTDADGKDVAPTSPPGNWLSGPGQKITLAAGEGGRLVLSKSGAGIAPNRNGHLELGSDRVWVFDRTDKKTYYLQGKIEVKPTGERRQWSGTLTLPRVKVPLGQE